MNQEQEALGYVIDRQPLSKRSRPRMALLCRRLHERVLEAIADEKRDSESLRTLANENEDLVARGQAQRQALQRLQSAYDTLDTDLSMSRARALALTGRLRRWRLTAILALVGFLGVLAAYYLLDKT